MPTALSITLDASQFNAAVAEVDASAKKMAQSVSSSSDVAAASLAKVTPAAGNVSRSVSAAGSQIRRAGGVVSALGSAFGAASPKLAIFGQILQSAVMGPIAWITAAIGALVSVATAVWDNLTESVEEYAAKCEQATAIAQRNVEKVEAQEAAASGYLDKLRELSSAESAGNAMRQATIDTLNVLQQSYGELGAKIDGATGKLLNFGEVEARVRARSAKKRADALDQQAEALTNQARAEFVKTEGNKWDVSEAKASSDFDFQNAFSTASDLAAWIQAKADESNDDDEIAGYGKAADYMRQAGETRARAASLRKNGFETEEEKTADTLAAQERAAKSKEALAAAQKRYAEQRSDDRFAELGTADAASQNAAANRQIENRQQRLDELTAQKGALSSASAAADKALADARRGGDAKQIAEAEKTLADILREKLTVSEKIYALEKQIDAIDRERVKRDENLQKGLRDEALELAGKQAEILGQGKSFAEERALEKARATKGGELTGDEESQVRRLAGLTWAMNHGTAPSFGERGIQTNALTARGGFAGGAVKPESERINREIARYSREQATTLAAIAAILRSGSRADTFGDVHRIASLLEE